MNLKNRKIKDVPKDFSEGGELTIQGRPPQAAWYRSRRAVVGLTFVAIFAAIVVLFAIKSRNTPPPVELSLSDFLNKLHANEIARATMAVDQQHLPLEIISGTFFKINKDGMPTKQEVHFVTDGFFPTPETQEKLAHSGLVTMSAPNRVLANVVWNVVPSIILGSILLIPVIIVLIVVRVANKRRAST